MTPADILLLLCQALSDLSTGVSVLAAAVALHAVAVALALAALASRHDPAGTALTAYFATSFVAAIFWAFPMPVVGAGPAHLIGFGLAIGWLAVSDRPLNRAVGASR